LHIIKTFHFFIIQTIKFTSYFSKNFEWLIEQLDEDMDDDYVIFDCPGQIELYTHLPTIRQLVEQLEKWNFRVCGVFLVDAQFLVDTAKFFSAVLAALSVMVTLEISHVNIMSKVDLLSEQDKENLER
jgi:GPN-loop GTPase